MTTDEKRDQNACTELLESALCDFVGESSTLLE